MKPEEYQKLYELEDQHWWYRSMRRITDSLLDRIHAGSKPLKILDAGCGTGAELLHLKKYGDVFGVDLSEAAVSLCRKRGQNGVLVASICELPFADNTFDLVTSFDVIYHLWVTDDVRALKEMRRVLKPGGTLLIRANAYQFLRGPHDDAVLTRERYTARSLSAKVRESGFSIQRVSYANTVLFPAEAAIRLLARTGIGKEEAGLKATSKVVNYTLTKIMSLEAALISKIDLPFGLSILCLARKDSSRGSVDVGPC